MALAKCGHPGCACLPADRANFCSDHCQEVAHHEPKEEKGCLCGHTGCDPRAVHHSTATELGLIEDDLAVDPAFEPFIEPRH